MADSKCDASEQSERQANGDPQFKELSWLQSQEIFEAMDASNIETVGFREFCALVFLIAAAESN